MTVVIGNQFPVRRALAGTQFARFLVIGGGCTLLDMVIYFSMTAGGFSPLFAKSLSNVLGMSISFSANKLWAFGSSERSVSQPLKYLLVYGTTFGVNIATNAICLSILGDDQRLISFLCATGLTTVLNFLGMKFFTFRTAADPKACL